MAFESFAVKPIEAPDLPVDAALTLWKRSGCYTDSARLIPSEFTHLYKITGEDEYATYAGEHTKAYRKDYVESNTYFVDVDAEDNEVGIGELRRVLRSDNDRYTPGSFVGWMATEAACQNSGLGRRRLIAMNLLSLALHDEPLKSGCLISDQARALWQHLVSDGLAAIDMAHRNDDIRYKFLNLRSS